MRRRQARRACPLDPVRICRACGLRGPEPREKPPAGGPRLAFGHELSSVQAPEAAGRPDLPAAHEEDRNMPVIPSFEDLVALEPRLAELLAEACSYADAPDAEFCAGTVWYG